MKGPVEEVEEALRADRGPGGVVRAVQIDGRPRPDLGENVDRGHGHSLPLPGFPARRACSKIVYAAKKAGTGINLTGMSGIWLAGLGGFAK